jgi:hypothetical protein
MSIRRITISVPAATAARIKKAAGGASVSAWVTGLIEERLDDAELERLWREFYASVAPRKADVSRANAMHKRLTRSSGRKSAA